MWIERVEEGGYLIAIAAKPAHVRQSERQMNAAGIHLSVFTVYTFCYPNAKHGFLANTPKVAYWTNFEEIGIRMVNTLRNVSVRHRARVAR
ncbi:MAG: hypothetical protein DRH12_16595 [Deltaproteobacteria bacterium]|nr:MAG: hypothetical protein DRH12_16595 [Deltaproteobacteria bacterium]